MLPTSSVPQIPLVAIPGGKAPQVAVSDFSMGVTPVTNAQYGALVNSLGAARFFLVATNPNNQRPMLIARGDSPEGVGDVNLADVIDGFSSLGVAIEKGSAAKLFMGGLNVFEVKEHRPPEGFERDDQPAVMIDWYGAFVFTELLRMMTGRPYSLPEALQWERAARVSSGGNFPTSTGELAPEQAHYAYDGAAMATVDVGDTRYPSMPNGLRHMAGNVWEWAMTDYRFPGRSQSKGKGFKVMLGGSWREDYEWLTSYGLSAFDKASHVSDNVGFRVVMG